MPGESLFEFIQGRNTIENQFAADEYGGYRRYPDQPSNRFFAMEGNGKFIETTGVSFVFGVLDEFIADTVPKLGRHRLNGLEHVITLWAMLSLIDDLQMDFRQPEEHPFPDSS